MGVQLVAVAIVLPVVAGALAYLVPSAIFRRVLVIGTVLILAAAAITLAVLGTFQFDLPAIGLDWKMVLAVADLLLALLLIYLAYPVRHRVAIVLAVIQLALLVVVEFGLGTHGEVHPTFALDRLSATLTLIVSIVGSLICVYAIRYMDEHEEHHQVQPSRQPRFFFFMLVFLGAMNGLVYANDLAWLFFFWEVTTLCSFMLIGHDGTPIAIANAARALWMNLLGGLGFGTALGLLAIQGREASWLALVSGPAAGGLLMLLPLALLVFAGFTKAAQMPFQSWLLGAMVAPTPVSALLHSSAMVKAGVYLVVRLAPGFEGTLLSYVVAFAGAFTFVMAAILALTQSDGKRVLAYSTVSNLGLIIACAGINTPLSLAAAVMLIIFHAVSKALLFMTVGSIEHAIGSRDIDAMEGLAQRHPTLGIIAAIGIVSMALPPAGMLLAKWVAIEAAGVALPLLTVILAVGSATTVGFWARWLGRLFTSPPGAENARVKLGAIYAWTLAPLLTAIFALSLGAGVIVDRFLVPGMSLYFPGGSNTLQEAGVASVANGTGWFPIGWLFAVLVVGLGLPAVLVRIKPSQIRPAYLGGENVKGSPGQVFMAAGDRQVASGISSDYYRVLFREDTLVRWANPVAIVLIAVLFAMGVR